MTSFPPMYMSSTSVHSGRFRLVVNNFDLSSSWFTMSNAFHASSVATISVDFVRLASARASVMTRLAMLGDLPMVKPNCRSFPGKSCSIPSFMQMSSTILHRIGYATVIILNSRVFILLRDGDFVCPLCDVR